ncbi:Glycerol 2-dehydrogenase (NADP(+)) [Purpureocillium takamizusanense]|uniref:Glycerol 2-dehydrogenase (NADP(+)) n=1 Tax=Purpureocillium takamizusanense TaxID=2060973 RepID=A0A9Q8Q883_9HYPO|nr:Glycerol 2-dehydrogenase (NADP(+)) [Purpureocillium takamizusanense]UNI15669.1 Glycerol 2-dehydrogenase (NADP(+)) [Purpureocillium takamizusanense]
MAPATHCTLNTGASVPTVGLGTWQAKPGEVGKAVEHALKSGYRHIDCALIYRNEKEVGDAIKVSGVPRSEIFITSKLWNTHQPDVAAGLAQTLRDLQTDYLDLYLVHWPVRLIPNETSDLLPTNPDGTRSIDSSWNQQDTWKQMEAVYQSGKVKAIGVSNWSVPYLEHLQKTWTVVPAVNQVELHPYNPQHKLKEWCDKHGIILEAYCPLGSTGAPLLEDDEITGVAKRYGVSPATVLISYQVNRGCIVLPKSVTASRIEQNLKVVALPKADMDLLNAMAAGGKQKRVNTPAWRSDLGFEDWYGPVEAQN